MSSFSAKRSFLRFWIIALLLFICLFVGQEISFFDLSKSLMLKPTSKVARFRAPECNCGVCFQVQALYSLPYDVGDPSGYCKCKVCDEMLTALMIRPTTINATTSATLKVKPPERLGKYYLDAGIDFDIDTAQRRSELYSSVRCVGGTGYKFNTKSRICILRNVCHLPNQPNILTYYANPDEPPRPVYWQDNDIMYQVDNQLAAMGTLTEGTPDWQISTTLFPVPQSIRFHPVRRAVAGRSVGGFSRGMDFSLFLCDTLFPMYASQAILGLQPSTDVQLIDVNDGTEEIHPNFTRLWELSEGLSKHPPMRNLMTEKPVCFRELIIGWSSLSCTYAQDVLTILGEPFRQFVLQNMGIEVPTKRRHSILFLMNSKSPDVYNLGHTVRPIVNFEETLDVLTKTFKDKYRIPITVIDPNTVPIKKQLKLAAEASLIITPPGNGALLAWFMSAGSAAIVLDVWDMPYDNAAAQSARHPFLRNLLGKLNFVSVLHYPVCQITEFVGAANGEAEYDINPSRLAYMVRLAFREIEKRVPARVMPRIPLPEFLPQYSISGVVCKIAKGAEIFQPAAADSHTAAPDAT